MAEKANQEIAQTFDTTIDEIIAQNGKLLNETKTLAQKITTLNSENAKLKQENAEKESGKADETKVLTQKIATLSSENSRLKQENTEKESRKADETKALTQKIATLSSENARLKQENVEKESGKADETKTLTQKIATLTSENSRLKRENAEFESENGDQRIKIDNLQGDIYRLNNGKKSLSPLSTSEKKDQIYVDITWGVIGLALGVAVAILTTPVPQQTSQQTQPAKSKQTSTWRFSK